MSDLTQLRDHARRQAASEHQANCDGTTEPRTPGYSRAHPCDNAEPHTAHMWAVEITNGRGETLRGRELLCRGICGGCQSDADQQMWARIADEIDTYLTGDDAQEGLPL